MILFYTGKILREAKYLFIFILMHILAVHFSQRVLNGALDFTAAELLFKELTLKII